MWFGEAPVINPKTGKPKKTVLRNWLLPPLREYAFLVVGLLLGLPLSAAVARCEGWSWPVKASELVQFQEGKFVLIPGMTYTYVDAIADSGMVVKDRERLCFPAEMLRTHLYVAVESSFNEHPEGLQRPAALVVMEALQRKWRCP